MPENKRDLNYSRPLEEADEHLNSLSSLESLIKELELDHMELERERQEILNDPEVQAGKKPLPEIWGSLIEK